MAARSRNETLPWWKIPPSLESRWNRVKQLHNEHGWSQGELAEQVGADPAQISRYENGRITPSLDALARIAEALNVSLDTSSSTTSPAARSTP